MLRVFILIFIFFSSFSYACDSDFSALVVDYKNNQILYEKDAGKIIYPASLAKIMTLYLTFEALEKNKIHLNQKIKISANVEDVAKINKINTSNLKENQEITVQDAIKASIVKSFNEASLALAEAVLGDEWNFVKKMNEKAVELKMFHTNFRNSTGLFEDGQYSSTYDLMRLLIAIQKKFPQYKKYFLQKDLNFNGQKYISHNGFLLEYKGAIGFKTGYTAKSGFNLMAGAKRGNDEIDAIIIACDDYKKRNELMKKIVDGAFARKALERDKKEIKIILK